MADDPEPPTSQANSPTPSLEPAPQTPWQPSSPPCWHFPPRNRIPSNSSAVNDDGGSTHSGSKRSRSPSPNPALPPSKKPSRSPTPDPTQEQPSTPTSQPLPAPEEAAPSDSAAGGSVSDAPPDTKSGASSPRNLTSPTLAPLPDPPQPSSAQSPVLPTQPAEPETLEKALEEVWQRSPFHFETLTFDDGSYGDGLTNFGNTCYLNALVQILRRTPYFIQYLEELWLVKYYAIREVELGHYFYQSWMESSQHPPQADVWKGTHAHTGTEALMDLDLLNHDYAEPGDVGDDDQIWDAASVVNGLWYLTQRLDSRFGTPETWQPRPSVNDAYHELICGLDAPFNPWRAYANALDTWKKRTRSQHAEKEPKPPKQGEPGSQQDPGELFQQVLNHLNRLYQNFYQLGVIPASLLKRYQDIEMDETRMGPPVDEQPHWCHPWPGYKLFSNRIKGLSEEDNKGNGRFQTLWLKLGPLATEGTSAVKVSSSRKDSPTPDTVTLLHLLTQAVGSDKQCYIARATPVLVLTLDRSALDKKRRKRLTQVKVEELLDLRPFVHPKEFEEIDLTYELYGVIVHKGRDLDSGHYYSYVNLDDQWIKYDDHEVSAVNAADMDRVLNPSNYMPAGGNVNVEKKDLRDHINVTPILLFYRRLELHGIPST